MRTFSQPHEPERGQGDLPYYAREIYRAAYNRALSQYRNDSFANQSAWTAVGRAGYRQDKETGEWGKE